MKRSMMIKGGLLGLGILFFAIAAYLRSQMEDENMFVILGVITIMVAIITFFFGEKEEKIVQEEDE